MKTRFTALLNVFALVCALGFASAHAQVPKTINYQGYLTTPSGAAVNGNVQMVFKIYDVATGGSALHTETQTVTVTNGIFNVRLGTSPLLGLPFTTPYFLGVIVAPDTDEMEPRRPFTSAPYAVTAENIAPGGNLYLTNSTATTGNIYKNGERFMHNTAFAGNNTFLGLNAGAAAAASPTFGRNVGIGSEALKSIQGGAYNVAVGDNAAPNLGASVFDNLAVGASALFASTGGNANVAIGGQALSQAQGDNNIGLGFGAGSSLLNGNHNIMIGNSGTSSDTGVIRIGDTSLHSQTHIAGTLNAAAIATLGAITTTSTLSATGGITNTGAISSTSGIAAATSVVAPKIGANVLAAAAERPVTIQADTSGGGSEWISFKNGTGATKWHVNNLGGGINFAETGQSDARLFLAAGGNVGIGTDVPTKAKLEINGSATGSLGSGQIFSSSGSSATPGGALQMSMYASSAVAAQFFFAFSDQRIKRVSGRSNAARDLSTLAAIEVTDYTHIDTPQRGDKSHKKVIAQQVETIYPQAVNKITDVVPDIYQRAAVKDGWIALEDPTKVNLKNGDRVRLIGKATQGVHEVLEVADGRFRTAFKADSDTIFVYGREVNDFRTVDYEAIAMLNVSATQELHRRLEAEAAKVRAQGAEIAQLKQQLALLSDLNAKVAWLMAQKAPAKP